MMSEAETHIFMIKTDHLSSLGNPEDHGVFVFAPLMEYSIVRMSEEAANALIAAEVEIINME